METDRLKYFCTIVETGSMTKAAELLGLSHSALSKSLSLLQQETGLQLMRPQGRGLEVTRDGRLFYERALKVISAVSTLTHPLRSPERNFLRVGVSEVFACSMSEAIVQELGEGVELHELDAGEMEVKILNDVIDFALCFTPFPHPELEYLKLKKISVGVFFTNNSFTQRQFSEIPFVTPLGTLKDNPLSVKSQDGWPSEKPRSVQFKVTTLTMAARLVAAGSAAIYAPRFAMEKLLGKRLHEIPGKYPAREVYLVKKKSVPESAAMKKLARLIRSLEA